MQVGGLRGDLMCLLLLFLVMQLSGMGNKPQVHEDLDESSSETVSDPEPNKKLDEPAIT